MRSAKDVEGLFRACADRTRLRILALLRAGEVCVGDLVTLLRVPQAKASRHLAYLRRAGLVRRRQAGPWCHYSLAPAKDAFHRRLLGCMSGCLGDLPEVKADARRARAMKRCCPAWRRPE